MLVAEAEAEPGHPQALKARRGRRTKRADRHRKRLRQAHPHQRIHAPRPGHQGDDCHPAVERNGKVTRRLRVAAEDEIMLITDKGVLVRTRVAEIREMGRATQGVTLMKLDEGAKLVGLERIAG